MSHGGGIPRAGFPVAGKDGRFVVLGLTKDEVVYHVKTKPKTPRACLRARHRRYVDAGGTLSFRAWLRDLEGRS